MQQNVTTEYAIRILISLAQAQRRVTASELSGCQRIPRTYISKIMVRLKEQGWLSVKDGARGGYELAVPPGDITLRQVLEAMSDAPVLCDERCPEHMGPGCGALAQVYRQLQRRVDAMLEGVTLEQLARGAQA